MLKPPILIIFLFVTSFSYSTNSQVRFWAVCQFLSLLDFIFVKDSIEPMALVVSLKSYVRWPIKDLSWSVFN